MDKAKVKQDGERIYDVLAHAERCKFDELRAICHLNNQETYNALIFLCRNERVQQTWDDGEAWYSIWKHKPFQCQ